MGFMEKLKNIFFEEEEEEEIEESLPARKERKVEKKEKEKNKQILAKKIDIVKTATE